MLSTVGLELANFVNPNLTWKKVRKGFRSTSRRSRKQAPRHLNMVARLGDTSPRRDGDSSVSESEKLGVAVLGHRFTDKPEHVPIKKRRLMFRSPSPSPRGSNPDHKESFSFNEQSSLSSFDDSNNLQNCKYVSSKLELFSNMQVGGLDGSTVINASGNVNDEVETRKINEMANGHVNYTDDFSGIELLAAAACSDIDDDTKNSKNAPVLHESPTQERLNSFISIAPMRDMVDEHNADDSLYQEDSNIASQKHHDDNTINSKKCTSKHERFHWDLNTVMDAWGSPHDDLIVDCQRNAPEDVLENVAQIEKLEIAELESLSTTSACFRDAQLAMMCDAKRQDGEACIDERVELPATSEGAKDESAPPESSKYYGDNTCINKVSSPFDDCRNSNVSQEDHGHLASVENGTKLQQGYDSPFEDGELRESVLYSWEENDPEELDMEFVECESNYQDDSDVVDYSAPTEKVDASGQILGKEISSSGETLNVQMNTEFPGNEDIGIVEEVGREGFNQASSIDARQASDVSGEDNSARKSHTSSDHRDGVDMKHPHAEEVGSRASRGKLLSRIEGRSSFYILDGKGPLLVRRSRPQNFDGTYHRQRSFACEKSIGRERLCSRFRLENEVDDDLIDASMGYWVPRDRYTTNYRCPDDHVGYTRSRSVNGDYVPKVSRVNGHETRDLNYSSKGMCRPSVRRRSPVERDDSYSLRRGMLPMRGISRGRSGICRPHVGRGPRGEYREQPLPDDTAASTLSMQHYLARKERSPSPSFGRGAYFQRPHRKSRSRSKTRSPPAWHFHREPNFVRRPSRSPEFKSEARMDRMTLPFQKRCFAADYEENITSPPRNRFLDHNSRWNNDRNNDRNSMDEHFRGRRSPVRLVRQRQRFDSASYGAGRLKTDDNNSNRRTVLHSGRFPLMGGPKSRFLDCNSRWNNDRNSIDEPFRGRRSPVRLVRPRQRFDSANNYGAERLKTDDNNRRTVLHTGRFPLMGGPDRIHKYDEGDYDRMKHEKRYEPIHRVRRNDSDGVARQTRYDAEDCYE